MEQIKNLSYSYAHFINNKKGLMHKINTVAYIIIKSATLRKESRGLHYTTDYPHKNNQELKDTIF